METNAKFIKTDVLLYDDGREFDLGRSRKGEVFLRVLTKDEALRLYWERKRVYFIYENNRIYKANCRKVCKDRQYLIDHYDVYHEVCGVVEQTVELCTFPKDDADYCLSFLIPKSWLLDILERMDSLNNREGVNLKNFLDNYCWDETWFIYEAAKADNILLKEETVK